MPSTSSYKRSISSSSTISKTGASINIDDDVISEQADDTVSVKSGRRMAVFWRLNRKIVKRLCWFLFSLLGTGIGAVVVVVVTDSGKKISNTGKPTTTKKPSTSKKPSKPNKPKPHSGE